MSLSEEQLTAIKEDQRRVNAKAIALSGAEAKASGWHKGTGLTGKPASDALAEQVGKALNGTLQPASSVPIMRSASSIEPRELEPLWDPVLWIGKLTLLVGDPGLGKSLATADIAARASTGNRWPCASIQQTPVDVLMIGAEDDPDDTVVPRLMAAGADLDRITFLDGIRETDSKGESKQSAVSLDSHMDALRSAVQFKGIRLLIVDPISAFLGRTDSHNNAEVRSVLADLSRLAAELRFAVLVVSHLNKMSGSNAVYRITGSLAFVAAARAVFAIARDPEDPDRRLMLPVKSNLGPDAAGYSYNVSVADNDAPFVRWGDERVTRSAEEVLATEPSARQKAVVERGNDVKDWLRKQLLGEPKPAASMWAAAERDGVSERDLRRAKKSLGVIAEVKGFRGAWHWSLPTGQSRTL